jgi:hypothetical protein
MGSMFTYPRIYRYNDCSLQKWIETNTVGEFNTTSIQIHTAISMYLYFPSSLWSPVKGNYSKTNKYGITQQIGTAFQVFFWFSRTEFQSASFMKISKPLGINRYPLLLELFSILFHEQKVNPHKIANHPCSSLSW